MNYEGTTYTEGNTQIQESHELVSNSMRTLGTMNYEGTKHTEGNTQIQEGHELVTNYQDFRYYEL